MKDLRDAKQILGMEMDKDRNNKLFCLSQKRYIDKVLKRFSMDSAKIVSTPLGFHFLLSKIIALESRKKKITYKAFHTQMLLEV